MILYPVYDMFLMCLFVCPSFPFGNLYLAASELEVDFQDPIYLNLAVDLHFFILIILFSSHVAKLVDKIIKITFQIKPVYY